MLESNENTQIMRNIHAHSIVLDHFIDDDMIYGAISGCSMPVGVGCLAPEGVGIGVEIIFVSDVFFVCSFCISFVTV